MWLEHLKKFEASSKKQDFSHFKILGQSYTVKDDWLDKEIQLST